MDLPLDSCLSFYCPRCGETFTEEKAFYNAEIDIFLCPVCGEVLKCSQTWQDYLVDALEELEIGGEENE